MLMVGAGGIGCELLKTLALSDFQDIHIVSVYLFLSFLFFNFVGFVRHGILFLFFS